MCDVVPSDLWKKAFKMRPRDADKELGPASFRSSNNLSELDLIRKRMNSEEKLIEVDGAMSSAKNTKRFPDESSINKILVKTVSDDMLFQSPESLKNGNDLKRKHPNKKSASIRLQP